MTEDKLLTGHCRGPLIFSLLLSLLLSINAHSDQSDKVFTGVFTLVWLGSAVVTLQIRLLGGSMLVISFLAALRPSPTFALFRQPTLTPCLQCILPNRLHHRLHALPPCHRSRAERRQPDDHRPDTRLHRPAILVAGGWCKHLGWVRSGEKQSRTSGLPALRFLRGVRLPVLH